MSYQQIGICGHGATPTFKGFPNQYGEPFPASLCTSVNEDVYKRQ